MKELKSSIMKYKIKEVIYMLPLFVSPCSQNVSFVLYDFSNICNIIIFVRETQTNKKGIEKNESYSLCK